MKAVDKSVHRKGVITLWVPVFSTLRGGRNNKEDKEVRRVTHVTKIARKVGTVIHVKVILKY